MKKRSLTFLKLAAAAAIAICLSAGSASAQSLEGSFTLPYEVHWGQAVLPAGLYTITFDTLRGPAIVSTRTGHGRAILMPVPIDKAMSDQPSALLVTRIENQYVVRYLNVREANVSFAYRSFTKSERKLAGKIEPEVVAILMARR